MHGAPRPRTPRSRADSKARLLRELLTNGPLSRAELAERLMLSGPSLTRLTRPLLETGRLVESEARQSSVGRPQQPLDIDPGSAHFIGVKVTADAAHAVRTDLRGRIEEQRDTPLSGHRPSAVVDLLSQSVEELRGVDGLDGVGISFGGATSDARTVSRCVYLDWTEIPLAALVENATGLPCIIGNDVASLGQAELWFGTGRFTQDFALITIGAGVGLSVATRGTLQRGWHGVFGQIAHLPLRGHRAPCWEFEHVGCATALLTTRAIARHLPDSPIDSETYPRLVFSAQRNPVLASHLHEEIDALGQLVGLVDELFDPAQVLIAGEGAGLAALDPDRLESARRGAGGARHHALAPLHILSSDWPQWARGAATLAIEEFMSGLP